MNHVLKATLSEAQFKGAADRPAEDTLVVEFREHVEVLGGKGTVERTREKHLSEATEIATLAVVECRYAADHSLAIVVGTHLQLRCGCDHADIEITHRPLLGSLRRLPRRRLD